MLHNTSYDKVLLTMICNFAELQLFLMKFYFFQVEFLWNCRFCLYFCFFNKKYFNHFLEWGLGGDVFHNHSCVLLKKNLLSPCLGTGT